MPGQGSMTLNAVQTAGGRDLRDSVPSWEAGTEYDCDRKDFL